MATQSLSLVKRATNWAIKRMIPYSGWGGSGGAAGSSAGGYEISESFIRNVINLASRYSGTNIDYANEVGDLLNSSLVMTAVNWVARALPEAQLTVVETDAEGKDVIVPNHPAIKLLNRPNPYFSKSSLWKAFAMSWICDGNPYFLKARSRMGEILELWYAPSFDVEPRWPLDGSQFISFYEYKVDGLVNRFDPKDVIHFRNGINPYNMRLGLSPVASILREIYSDSQVMNYQGALLANGAVPPAILSVKSDALNGIDADPKEIKDNYLRSTQGDERGKIFVSGIAVELTKIAFSPSEMDLQILRALPEKRFAAVIGLPDEILGLGSGDVGGSLGNGSVMEVATQQAYESFMIPLWRFIEDELTVQLMPDFKGSENYRFKFDLKSVRALSLDEDALFKRWSMAYKTNWVKKSEARAAAGLKVMPEDEVYYEQERAMQQQAQSEQQLALAEAQAAAQPKHLPPGNPKDKQPPVEQKSSDFSIAMILLSDAIKKELLDWGARTIPPTDFASPEKNFVKKSHITLKYGLHVDNPEFVAQAVAGFGAFDVEIGLSKTMQTKEGFLVYFPAYSPKLKKLFKIIADATSHSESFDEYLPHISLCWITREAHESGRYAGKLATVSLLPVPEIVFSDREGKQTIIPLDGPATKSIPKPDEINEALDWWAKVAPDEAVELVNAAKV